VKGFVVAIDGGDAGGLREIAQVSGRSTAFDTTHLEALKWCALHYVAPLSVVLERTLPPNNPPAPAKTKGGSAFESSARSGSGGAGAPGARVWLTARPDPSRIAGLVSRAMESGRSTMVVLPTAAEAIELAGDVAPLVEAELVLVHGDLSARSITDAWGRARHEPVVVVGTPRVAAWAIHQPATVVVVEESRRAMKDRQTPTVHARDLLRVRARTERFGLVFAGPTPSVEVLAAGPSIESSPGRLWSLVEVVDRRSEPPGAGPLTEAARHAIRSVVSRGGRSFVFAHRRGYAAAMRCVKCRTVRKCIACGSRPDPGDSCSRCGAPVGACEECGAERFEALGAGVGRLVEEVARIVGRDRVGEFPFDGPIEVGTERDLAGISGYDLVIFTDVDGMLFGTSFRAAEECLRVGGRLAGAVRHGSGRRLLLQTSEPDHPVVTALRRADPIPALRALAEERSALGYPPAGELLVIEIRGEVEVGPIGETIMGAESGTAVMGPAAGPNGHRWLVQGQDLSRFRRAVRPHVQRWRDSGAVVRIDVDPIDL
jgi:primosomal protein N' (replication factor Y)